MSLYGSYKEYLKAMKKEQRIKQNRNIDLVVKNSIKDIVCDCGEVGNFKQKKRGTYLIICNICKTEFKLEE
jgi:hypothetical protein